MDDDLQHIWNIVENRGAFQYLIDRDFPLVRQLENSLDEAGLQYLDSLIKMIEDTFPYGDVYFRMAKNENSVQTSSLEFEEAYKVGRDMVDSFKSMNGDVGAFLKNLSKIDFFIKYPEVVAKLQEEFSDDK